MQDKSFSSEVYVGENDIDNLIEYNVSNEGSTNETSGDVLKRCPFCAELIQLAAIKCRYCGSMLRNIPKDSQKDSILQSFSFLGSEPMLKFLFIAILVLGLIVISE